MGLDMYAYKVEKGLIAEGTEIDFDSPRGDEYVSEDWYWRKNNYLHGWMENLYRRKGGEKQFNCVNLILTEEDLQELESAIKDKSLVSTSGFFFGGDYDYYGEYGDAKNDLKFVREALYAIEEEGMDVYYSSWW